MKQLFNKLRFFYYKRVKPLFAIKLDSPNHVRYAIGIAFNIVILVFVYIFTHAMIEFIYQTDLHFIYDSYLNRIVLLLLLVPSIIIWIIILLIDKRKFSRPLIYVFSLIGVLAIAITWSTHLIVNANTHGIQRYYYHVNEECYYFRDLEANLAPGPEFIQVFDIIIIEELEEQISFNYFDFSSDFHFDGRIYSVSKVSSYRNDLNYDRIYLSEHPAEVDAFNCRTILSTTVINPQTAYLIQGRINTTGAFNVHIAHIEAIPNYDVSKPLEEQAQEVLDWLDFYINYEYDEE